MSKPIPFLSLKNLTLKQGGEIVFPHTHWTVNSHEHWAIVGPNGSGKSTLMRAVCGRVPVVGGRIVYHFAHQAGAKPESHIVHVAFDAADNRENGDTFYQARWNSGVAEPGHTVTETLSEQGVWQRNPFEIVEPAQITPHFDDLRHRIIDQLEIENLLNRELQQLSNGERRKVSIARALMREPKLLILDNVFAGLDPDYRKHLDQLIDTLMQTPMRVFMVTSDPEKIPTSYANILVIRDHRVVDQGPRVSMSISLTHSQLHQKNAATPSRDQTAQLQPHAAPSNILIHMRHVSITYNGTHILRDVNWKVCRGERWALLGHNGAGKTTLLSLIMGDHPQAYANEIELFGRRRGSGESIWEIKRRIGWMSPELQRHTPPLSSCFDVVCSGWFDSVGLYRQCTPEQRATAQEVMTGLQITALTQQQFRNVSETEQRLVLLARALVKHPQLLILDEPCQGLDTRNRQFVYQILDKTTPWAESLILVTHHTHQLPQSITHSLTLHEGHTTSRGVHGPAMA